MTGLAGRIILLYGWKRAALAIFAGAFAVLALPPFDFFAAAFVSFTLLVLLIEGAVAPPNAGPLRRIMPAVKIGWQFGFGYFLAGLWWLGNALLVEADEFAWAIPLAVLVLPAGWRCFTRSLSALRALSGPRASAPSPRSPLDLALRNGCGDSCSPAFPGTRLAISPCPRRC